MKIILITMMLITIIAVVCQGQPNTNTTVQIGIVNMQLTKDYRIFTEIKEDSTASRLVDGMDYLDPDVSDLDITDQLINPYVIADTTFWDYEYPDVTFARYAKGGLVQVDLVTLKYSSLTASDWVVTDSIEPNSAGFIFRKK